MHMTLSSIGCFHPKKYIWTEYCLAAQTPPGYERPSIRAVQQSASTKVDYRPVRPDRLARAPYRSGPRARESTQPLGAVMGHDCTFKARPIGGESCSGQDQGSFSSADLQRELPSVGEALDRQAPVASTSQPSIGKQNNTQSDPSKGVRVYVMLPLDTVSSSAALDNATSPSVLCQPFWILHLGAEGL